MGENNQSLRVVISEWVFIEFLAIFVA